MQHHHTTTTMLDFKHGLFSEMWCYYHATYNCNTVSFLASQLLTLGQTQGHCPHYLLTREVVDRLYQKISIN